MGDSIMTIAKDMKQLPWKFSIGDETQGIFRKLTEGISTRIFSGENVMLSVVKLEPNTAGTVHSHPEEQWGVLLEGACVRIQGDEELTMKEGDFWYTPCGVSHGIRTGETGATVLDVFSPPRNEYKKQGEGFSSSTLTNEKG
jgi:quercetin dioxygenase-like cupin family protein